MTGIKSIILEMKTKFGPYGAKGMGEMPNIPTAPAIIIIFRKTPTLRRATDAGMPVSARGISTAGRIRMWTAPMPLPSSRILAGVGF